MKTYRYSVSTSTIWTSFDNGEVEAEDIEAATKLAVEKLKYDFEKANEALAHCDVTKGFSIEFSEDQVQVELREAQS
jgi:hypothetical protein